VSTAVLPVTDDPVRTMITTQEGTRPFQEWFVRDRCAPQAVGVTYAGLETARPTPEVVAALSEARLVIVAPSNPYLSVGPMIALEGIVEALSESAAPVVAVSPIVGGHAIKGPAAEMLSAMAGEASAYAVASLYAPFLRGMVVDQADRADAGRIAGIGLAVHVCDTLMVGAAERAALAEEVCAFGVSLGA
jgi:LPPG:FO 2-phospho-L-lactate transferase